MDLSESTALTSRPSLAYSPHPLVPAQGRQLIHVEFLPGETIQEFLVRHGIAQQIGRRPVICTISGTRVPRRMWKHCRPKPGTLVNLTATVRGGSGGKNPVGALLQIGLMVGANVLLPGAGMLLARAAITLIGGMVINALFPPPKPQLADPAPNAAQDSPTYALTGGSNRMRPFEPMPAIMGMHRVFPDAGSQAYTEFAGVFDEPQIFYQVFDFGYNDLDLDNFKIGTTPIGDLSGITMQVSDSTGALTLFPANVDSQPGAALNDNVNWLLRTSSAGTTQLGVEITGVQFHVSATGVVDADYIRPFQIQYREVGSASWLPFIENGATDTYNLQVGTRKPFRLTFQLAVAAGQYEVRCKPTLADPDPNQANYFSQLVWSQLRSYQPDTADYTGRKRVALKIQASGQLNGQVAQLSAIARAKPDTWNGSAWVAGSQTSNPADWFMQVLHGKSAAGRRVWGAGIADSRIDFTALAAWRAYCETQGLTFNFVFDQPISVFDMLSAIALAGRGTVSMAGGKYAVVWDAAAQPISAVFGMSNIIAGSFEISYASNPLADEIIGKFINPELDWMPDTVRVVVPGVTTPVNSRSVELVGCTDKSLAGRATNLYAATNAYRNRRYKWHTDFEGMVASRGDVVELAHDLASLDYSGRFIEGGSTTVLKLECQVPLYAAGAFIVIVKPDGTFASYAVNGGAGDTNTLTASSALSFNPWTDVSHPPYDYKWLYGATATPGKKVKIDSIQPLDERTLEVTAVDEFDEFYALEFDLYTYTPPRPVFGGGAISNLALGYDGVRVGAGYLVSVTASWDVSGNYSFADVSVSIAGGAAQLLGQSVRGRSFDFTMADDQDVTVTVIAYGQLQRLGAGTNVSVTEHINFAELRPPSDVAALRLSGNTFSWDQVADVDVLGYHIKFQYGPRFSWADANELHGGLITQTSHTFEVLVPQVITYLIKAVDAHGESANAAVLTVDMRSFTAAGDPIVANVVQTFDLKALGFPGTLTNATISGGNFVADSSTSMYNVDDDAPMYGADTDPFYPAALYELAIYESTPFVVTGALVGSRMTIAQTIAGQPIYVDYRNTGPDSMYGLDADSFYGDDGDPFYQTPGDYVPWPGAIITANAEYQIRVTIGEGSTQGVISELTATVDAPDITEQITGAVLAAGGTRLALTRSYQSIKAVALTQVHDGGTAIRVELQDRSTAGPLCRGFDVAGAGAAATTDAIIQGY